MKAVRIVLASVTGTAFMSLFSYFVSERRKKQFKEPVILSALIRNTDTLQTVKKDRAHQLGWILHYLAGLSFSMAYDQIWRKTDSRPSLQNGIVFGGINGLVGILIWKSAIDAHPRPPLLDYKKYYSHLLAAHFVFGAFAAVGYMIPSWFQKKGKRVLEIRQTRTRPADEKKAEERNTFHRLPHDVNTTHH